MSYPDSAAPGAPGIPARWTSSAKTGVGTALSDESRVWFTTSHGILNEIYFPTIDHACIRDMGFIVTDAETFFSEEKTGSASSVSWLTDGVPAFDLVNTCHDGRYTIGKQIVTDPRRDTVLQQVQFYSPARISLELSALYPARAASGQSGRWQHLRGREKTVVAFGRRLTHRERSSL